MEHEIPFGNSNRENGTTFLDFPLFLGIFQWDEPTKRVPFTAEPEIPEILSKWKAPSVCTYSCMKNGDFEAISVNERHSMRHVDLESGASHIGKVPHFIE